MKNVYIVEFLSADRGFDRFDFQVFRNRRSALRYIDQFMSSVKENAGHLFDRDGVIECKDIYRDEDMLDGAEKIVYFWKLINGVRIILSTVGVSS